MSASEPIHNAETGAPQEWEPWPDSLPLEDQVWRLSQVLMYEYPHTFDRSEGAMEKAARLLFEAAAQEPAQFAETVRQRLDEILAAGGCSWSNSVLYDGGYTDALIWVLELFDGSREAGDA